MSDATSMPSPAADPETAATVARPRPTQHRSVVRGTGNSAAKLNRTNVWGDQALDLGKR